MSIIKNIVTISDIDLSVVNTSLPDDKLISTLEPLYNIAFVDILSTRIDSKIIQSDDNNTIS